MSAFSAYPSFAFLFDGSSVSGRTHSYLTLLNLFWTEEDAASALAAVRVAARASAHIDGELAALFREVHWRPNLVAATVMALGYGSDRSLVELWEAFERGTWVTPQLAVAASLRDPAFADTAQRHIEHWSTRVNWSRPGPEHGDPKNLSALLYLCGLRPSCDEWLDGLVPSATIQAALARDLTYDRGGRIAMDWLERIQRLGSVQREE